LTHDGKRQLALFPAGKPPLTSIAVVMNWPETVKKR